MTPLPGPWSGVTQCLPPLIATPTEPVSPEAAVSSMASGEYYTDTGWTRAGAPVQGGQWSQLSVGRQQWPGPHQCENSLETVTRVTTGSH